MTQSMAHDMAQLPEAARSALSSYPGRHGITAYGPDAQGLGAWNLGNLDS
jgi:hypothetical protein